MIITLRLPWLKKGAPAHRAFRLPGAANLVSEYVSRIGRYCPCCLMGGIPERNSRVWLCAADSAPRGGGPASRPPSSLDVAQALRRERDSSCAALEVLIGGPDGIPADVLAALKPTLRWSFGPMTLPHELAAIVAAEQLYRAWTILNGEPYHLDH